MVTEPLTPVTQKRSMIDRASELMRQLATTECKREQRALWNEAQRLRIAANRLPDEEPVSSDPEPLLPNKPR